MTGAGAMARPACANTDRSKSTVAFSRPSISSTSPAASASSASYQVSVAMRSRQKSAGTPVRSAYTEAMSWDCLSSSVAASRSSAALPTATVQPSWIIMDALGAITIRSPAWAMTEAMDAASPSILTVTVARWLFSAW